jgi:hypothetical protein
MPLRPSSLDPHAAPDAQGPGASGAPQDPLVEACVADALAPFRDLLPAGAAAEMREALALLLEAHPVLAPMLDGLRPRAVVASSGDVAREEALSARDAEGPLPALDRARQGSR